MKRLPVDLDSCGTLPDQLVAWSLGKADLLSYLKRGVVVVYGRRLLGDRVDPSEPKVLAGWLCDGQWVWSLEACALLERHDMGLPPEFLDWVKSRPEVPLQLADDQRSEALTLLAT